MSTRKSLTSKEISVIVDGFEPIEMQEIDFIAKLTQGQRIFRMLEKAEMVRTDLRNKLMKDLPEISMKVLRSLTPVQIGKTYTEPAYYGWLC